MQTYTLTAEIQTATGIIRLPAVTGLLESEIDLHKNLIRQTATVGDTVDLRVGREG